ncbi:16S rRNA (cytosine(967)-C(5))-methyltransferase RsmB [Pseudogracilibacillus sp. ICA-222130]|uniref:16S rRNA (cytosine(967)-C(5))-methyltransferase RsmB n=1 Tax=Pseudogracilibacillus sp. ICA-222130 TaxID=3134655 RepID=UPI0030BD8AF0
MKNVREVALELLLRVEKSGSYSHLLINQVIDQGKVHEKDAALLTEIVYGTIERKMTLDFYVQPFITKQKNLQDWVRVLLRMSIFQLVYLDQIPSYAVINEAVEIAKKRGHKGISSVVNGVLRSFQRQGPPSLDTIPNQIERLAIKTSHPTWLVSYWVQTYGYERTEEMCIKNNVKKPMYIRVNQLKTTREMVMERLKSHGIEATACTFVPDALKIVHGNVLKTNLLKDGYITVQDYSSMFASYCLDVAEGMTVLDTCSAPGGKVTYVGEMMHQIGDIYAYDLHKNKTKLIRNNAIRLGIENITVAAKDARTLREEHENETFDRILVDAPCTGLGVLRSKADIKYHKQEKDMEALQKVQIAILKEIAPLLKQNGKLIYSTCTVNTIENEAVVQAFLAEHTDFKVDKSFITMCKEMFADAAHITEKGIQLFPQTLNADGFFITRLVKK